MIRLNKRPFNFLPGVFHGTSYSIFTETILKLHLIEGTDTTLKVTTIVILNCTFVVGPEVIDCLPTIPSLPPSELGPNKEQLPRSFSTSQLSQ